MKTSKSSPHIKLFGSPQITDSNGNQAAVMKSNKGIALLAYLIFTKEPHSREELADLLWDAASTKQSQQNLRKLLSRIRGITPGLQVTRKEVAFISDEPENVDLYTFRAALTTENHQILDKALKLVNGQLLDGFYLEDAPRFNEWLALEREKTRRFVTAAFKRLCIAYSQEKDWKSGVEAAQRWLALDELDEVALLTLMQMLAASGQVGLALQQYEFTRQRLWDEIGVEPEPEITKLAQRLEKLKSEVGEGLAWSVIVGEQFPWPESNQLAEPGFLPVNSCLPYYLNNDFVGRQNALIQLAEQLLPWPYKPQSNENSMAVITGMGGVGKTQLAVEYAYRYGRFYPGGVLWMSFADAENVANEVAAIGSEKGMALFHESEQLTLAERVGRVQRVWREAIPRLLIFDNCEEEDLLTKWAPITGGCRVLLTSRRANWSRDLHVHPHPLSTLETAESVGLLQKLVPGLAVEDALKIANEVGHLPLALHLVGSFLRRYRQINPSDYLTQLRNQGLFQHPSLQGRGVDYSPTGHERHVARTFTINLQQLDKTNEADILARKLLARAACFAPGEPIPRRILFSTIIGNEEDLMTILSVEDALVRLVDLGFLEDGGDKWVVMHRLIVTFLQESANVNETALTDVKRAVFWEMDKSFTEKASAYALGVASAHVRHLIALDQKRDEIHTANLAHNLGLHLNYIADFEGSRYYLQRALTIYRLVHSRDHTDIARCLQSLGTLSMREGAYQKALPLFEQALAIHENILGPNDGKVGFALSNIGYLLSLQGANQLAQPYLERAHTIFEREFGPQHLRTAIGLNNLGVVLLNLGHLVDAQPCLERALKIREQELEANHPYTAVSLQNMGLYFLKLKDFEKANDYLERSLIMRKKILGDTHPHTARSLNALGEFHLTCGETTKARSNLEQALEIQRKILKADHPEIGLTLKNIGDLHWGEGKTAEARAYFEQARAILEKDVAATHPELRQAINRLAILNESDKAD